MDNVIEEGVMVEPMHDTPDFRRQNKKLAARQSVLFQAGHWITEPVSLSPTSQPMETLKTLILSDPEIQANKTAFIKEAIAEGRYEINSRKIGEKMLVDALLA